MAATNNIKNENGAAPPNAPFEALVRRSTTAAGAIAAEDHATNPWTSPPRARTANYFEIRQTARSLPAAACRQDFLKMYHENQIIILAGDTGSGKTTQIPQYILYDDLPGINLTGSLQKKVVCTQPRRVAAMEVAGRVANELDVKLGEQVGYQFRHENVSSLRTLLLYTTDGHLLQELKADRNLQKYSCIIIDEAHERTVASDLLLGMIKKACERRVDLKLVVMSATMDANKFRRYFDDAPLLTVPGRTHPVEVSFLAAVPFLGSIRHTTVPEYVVAAIRVASQIAEREAPGDILIFMPGKEDIRLTVAGIMTDTQGVVALGLHAEMTKAQQSKVLAPLSGDKQHFRKCIVATNVAETSLTIDGIVYVIDTGLEKSMGYNPRLRMEILLVAPISQAAANQRKGRAGRTRPGKCFRLYSAHGFGHTMQKERLPDIQRSSMEGPILDLLGLKANLARPDDIITFPYIDPPAPEIMMRSWDNLVFLGLLQSSGFMSPEGNLATRLPIDPRHAAAFIQAMRSRPAPVWEISAIISLLNEETIFLYAGADRQWSGMVHASFSHPDGDHLSLLNIWHAFCRQADHVCRKKSAAARADHLYRWCQEHFLKYEAMMSAKKTFATLLDVAHEEMKLKDDQKVLPAKPDIWMTPMFSRVIRKTLLKAGFLQIAVRVPGNHGYRTLGENMPGLISPLSSIVGRQFDFIIYDRFVRTYKCLFVNATGIDSQWLFEEPLSLAYVDSLLAGYIKNSEKWYSIQQLKAAKAKFEGTK